MFTSFSWEKEAKAIKVPYILEKHLALVSPIIRQAKPKKVVMSVNRMEAKIPHIYHGMPNIIQFLPCLIMYIIIHSSKIITR